MADRNASLAERLLAGDKRALARAISLVEDDEPEGWALVRVRMAGSGDSVQALKAGVMEIPDVIVVNKADHPLTDTMVREVRGVLSLAPHEGWRVPIVKTEAVRGEGVEELAARLAEHRDW